MTVSSAAGVAFDLSGVAVRVRGAAREIGERLAREWSPFRADPESAPEPLLDVEVSSEYRPAPSAPFAPKAMVSELQPTAARYLLPEGEVVVRDSGPARLALSSSVDPARRWYAFANLLRAALAWRLPSRRAALLHAAGIVLDGRAFLLVGPEGSGKSTWASIAGSAGAWVLSDDLVLVDGSGPDVEALGAPFRSTHTGPAVPGRWPVAAVLLPERGTAPRLGPVDALRVRARVAANLPFVGDALERDGRVADVVERISTGAPARSLAFAVDRSFVDVLRAFTR